MPRILCILKEVWQGCGKQDVLVDVGLTWRVTPWVSDGRASRATVRARVSTPWWETIVRRLFGEITVEI